MCSLFNDGFVHVCSESLSFAPLIILSHLPLFPTKLFFPISSPNFIFCSLRVRDPLNLIIIICMSLGEALFTRVKSNLPVAASLKNWHCSSSNH